MGRQGVPTHLKLLRGNPGQRRILPEPEPRAFADVPEPPEELGELGREEWFRVAPELLRLGILTTVDIKTFAGYCQANERRVLAERAIKQCRGHGLTYETSNGNHVQNPLVNIANTAAREMLKFAMQLGMTPVSRRHLASNADRPTAKFDGLT